MKDYVREDEVSGVFKIINKLKGYLMICSILLIIILISGCENETNKKLQSDLKSRAIQIIARDSIKEDSTCTILKRAECDDNNMLLLEVTDISKVVGIKVKAEDTYSEHLRPHDNIIPVCKYDKNNMDGNIYVKLNDGSQYYESIRSLSYESNQKIVMKEINPVGTVKQEPKVITMTDYKTGANSGVFVQFKDISLIQGFKLEEDKEYTSTQKFSIYNEDDPDAIWIPYSGEIKDIYVELKDGTEWMTNIQHSERNHLTY